MLQSIGLEQAYKIDRPALVAVALSSLIALTVGLTVINLGDFDIFYRAATLARQGINPYNTPGFYSPLQVLVFFIPLSLLPQPIAFRLASAIGVFLSLMVLYRISRSAATMLIALCGPFVLMGAYYGNIDWMPLTALIAAPPFGVFLALAKPQVGWILAIVLLLRMRRSVALLTLCAVVALFAVSFALGMNWSSVPGQVWNISAWPWGIPIGVALLVYALRRRDKEKALAASVFVAPYLSPMSYVALMPAALTRRRLLIGVLIVQWVILIVWRGRI